CRLAPQESAARRRPPTAAGAPRPRRPRGGGSPAAGARPAAGRGRGPGPAAAGAPGPPPAGPRGRRPPPRRPGELPRAPPAAHRLAAVDIYLVRGGQPEFPGQRGGQGLLGDPGMVDVDPEVPAAQRSPVGQADLEVELGPVFVRRLLRHIPLRQPLCAGTAENANPNAARLPGAAT